MTRCCRSDKKQQKIMLHCWGGLIRTRCIGFKGRFLFRKKALPGNPITLTVVELLISLGSRRECFHWAIYCESARHDYFFLRLLKFSLSVAARTRSHRQRATTQTAVISRLLAKIFDWTCSLLSSGDQSTASFDLVSLSTRYYFRSFFRPQSTVAAGRGRGGDDPFQIIISVCYYGVVLFHKPVHLPPQSSLLLYRSQSPSAMYSVTQPPDENESSLKVVVDESLLLVAITFSERSIPAQLRAARAMGW